MRTAEIHARTVRLLAGLPSTTVCVALWHAVNCNKRGICRDTYERIAFELDCSIRSVQRSEAQLVDEGLGKIVIRDGQRVGFDVSELLRVKVDRTVARQIRKAAAQAAKRNGV